VTLVTKSPTEPAAAADRAGISVIRDITVTQPARLLSFIVRLLY